MAADDSGGADGAGGTDGSSDADLRDGMVGFDGAFFGPDGGGAGDGSASLDAAANPNNPDNRHLDTDCDGLSDAYEFSTVYPNGDKTDPNLADSDGDGLPDGVEAAVTSSVSGSGCPMIADGDPTTRTSPVDEDTDGDGITDGREDANHNGAVDLEESNPLSTDSDGDLISDAVEDANHDGVRDPTELDPTRRDTDRDGIDDGVEDTNHNGVFEPGETDPRSEDTDGDTLADGDEDSNHDGVHEPFEVDPRTADTDCDGISDGAELAGGTSPLVIDSDGDGIPDGVESAVTSSIAGSGCAVWVPDADPATSTANDDADSDHDGVSDGVEDANHNGRVDMGELDPNDLDSDDDGIPDGDEVLAGTDPLNPNDPSPDVVSGVQTICGDANLKVVDFHVGGPSAWTLATEPSFVYQTVSVSTSTRVVVAGFDDTASAVSGFIVRMPVMPGARTSAVQASLLSTRVGGAAAGEGLSASTRSAPRNIVTHDGFETAVSGVVDYTVTSGSKNASEMRNALVRMTTGLSAAAFTGLSSGTGSAATSYTYAFQVLVRTAPAELIVVGAILDRPAYDAPTDPRAILVNDLTNGTALALADARRSKDCDPFVAGASSVADFIWMADISSSTDDDRGRIANSATLVFNALASNGVDFRMGVVPHTENDIGQGAGNGGDLRGSGFTRNVTDFVAYLNDASGANGCEFGLEAASNAIDKALPRTAHGAAENAHKLRADAVLAVVYISDEFAQELTEGADCNSYDPGGTACSTGIADLYTGPGSGNGVCTFIPNGAQQACIDGVLAPYISQIQGQNGIAFAQVFDPSPPGQCNAGQFHCPQPGSQAGNEPGRGYVDVVGATGGTSYSPCVDDPGAALQAIVDAVSGAASQYQLNGPPISSTLKVGLTHQGTTVTTVVPRDKQDGFDYDPVANAIYFHGSTYRPVAGDRVTVSYRLWQPPVPPCGGPCAAGLVCDPQLGICGCDLTACNSACGPTEVCAASCQCACAVDCNGQCGAGQVCNQSTCQCECAPDCGGACGSGTVCNPTTCACECDGSCGGACAAPLACDQGACNCQCPSDCGGACTGNTVCNDSTCACACAPDCNAHCAGAASCDPRADCACVCPADCGGCPDNTVCNPGSCACECDPSCDQTCGGHRVCDPNDSCNCVCPVDCGGCAPNETCNQDTCTCRPIV